MIGDSCARFVELDQDTTLGTKVLWARILVKWEGKKKKPNVVNILAGARSYKLQIWWEVPPLVTGVYPTKFVGEGVRPNLKEKDEGTTSASQGEWKKSGLGIDGCQKRQRDVSKGGAKNGIEGHTVETATRISKSTLPEAMSRQIGDRIPLKPGPSLGFGENSSNSMPIREVGSCVGVGPYPLGQTSVVGLCDEVNLVGPKRG